ncbi:MAG TPA: HEAT repeat domain-containing protein, partial [bacterium]|nr:HEAT repeat domain-containing protein [bacterium]
MKRLFLCLAVIIISAAVVSQSLAQTTRSTGTTSTSTRTSTRTGTGTSGTRIGGRGTTGTSGTQYDRQSDIASFLSAIIGGMMRHPDPIIRKQAVQSVIQGAGGTTTSGSSSTNTQGVRGLLSTNTTTGSPSSSTNTGSVGVVTFVPDLYMLLADPDPEVRDIASVGLDVLFGTDMTLMRMMNDEDPIIRKYATKTFASRNLRGNREGTTGSTTNEEANTYELLALRTLLVRLKYEKDLTVRKTIIDALEWYVSSGGTDRDGGGRELLTGRIFGIDAGLLKYLEDENPEVRKNAIRVVSSSDYNPQTLELFFEMFRKEKDPEVKKA